MKRIMLAAGPWVMDGTNCATRVVAYEAPHKTDEIVVHTQHYRHGVAVGEAMSFTNGSYFKKKDMAEAMERWADRNRLNLPNHVTTWEGKLASYEFATAANSADLMSQYVRENPPGWASLDDVPAEVVG